MTSSPIVDDRSPGVRRVVLSGGPGAGKTTLLHELGRRGHATVGDSAREVIAERVARGLPRRPDAQRFAREILLRDIEKYALQPGGEIVFHDRSAVESLGMLREAGALQDAELSVQLTKLRYFETVFMLPPWPDIYRTDSERDHSFDHAQRVHQQLVRWYGRCGYRLVEVPRLPVAQRADHVLRHLHAAGA